MKLEDGNLVTAGDAFRIEADVVFTAIGQTGAFDMFGSDAPQAKGGKFVVDADYKTTLPGVWAGGDCIVGGLDLTVSAVEDGKQAARSILKTLLG